MAKRLYTSFEAIDRDLQILKLQREIDVEELKLNVQETRASLYPTQLLGGMGGMIRKFLLTVLARKLAERFK